MRKQTLIKQVRRRWSALKSERSGWEAVWRDIQRFVVPDMGRFKNPSKRDDGQRNDDSILDNTATRALRTLAAGWLAGSSSPAQPSRRAVAERSNQSTSSDAGRREPASMSALRCSGEEYIGVRSPVAAQWTRLPTASARVRPLTPPPRG